jgi:hypothetical protein
MFLKCYHHLHHVINQEIRFANYKVNENCNLNIFEMTSTTNELVKKLDNKNLLIFKRCLVNVKEI